MLVCKPQRGTVSLPEFRCAAMSDKDNCENLTSHVSLSSASSWQASAGTYVRISRVDEACPLASNTH